jgi:hypothetical protein
VIWLVVPPCLDMQLIADLQLPVKSPLLFHVQKMLSTQKHFAK